MPVTPVNTGTNTTLQQVVNSARAYPELTPVLGASGWTQEPALTIANDVMQRFLAQNMDWKFNRSYVPPFLTVALQQDYITSITDLGWLESAWRLDINNTATPKPIFLMEAGRDLPFSSSMATPFQLSWLPNRLAQFGTWQANTAYASGLGVAQTPNSPIQQFTDVNGNFLYVTGFGTSGAVEPSCPSQSVAGVTVTDGSVTWTVADPNGIAIRLGTLPPTSGTVWSIAPIYQQKPPLITSLQQTLAPIPDEMMYLFRQGFLALCFEHAGSKNAVLSYQKWEEALMIALRSGDREVENYGFYPSDSLTGGRGFLPIGPANPYWSLY